MTCYSSKMALLPFYIAVQAGLIGLFHGIKLAQVALSLDFLGPLALNHWISSSGGTYRMLFLSYLHQPLCQNLLGGYELLQVQLCQLWLQIHGSFQKFCVWWQYYAVLHMTTHITFMTLLVLRGLLEKYPTFGREKETGLPGALDT
jgi:hypothetical protein